LIGIGRRVLREDFKHAQVGLSGVNFAVANQGLLCLVENEGNGRMSTSVPDTHIALMGIDKVIPDLEALPPLLHLLTRSATGQAITTYLNFICGPRRPDELDGPREVHLILLDNGRSAIAGDEDMQSTLSCIRCGACMNHCPVYTKIGGHAYGSVYPGPIGQVISPQLKGGQGHVELLSACSLNGACGEVCPVNIPLPALIRKLRAREQNHSKKWFETLVWHVWKITHASPRLYALSGKLLRRKTLLSRLFPLAWRKHRAVPVAARRTLKERLRASNHDH